MQSSSSYENSRQDFALAVQFCFPSRSILYERMKEVSLKIKTYEMFICSFHIFSSVPFKQKGKLIVEIA